MKNVGKVAVEYITNCITIINYGFLNRRSRFDSSWGRQLGIK